MNDRTRASDQVTSPGETPVGLQADGELQRWVAASRAASEARRLPGEGGEDPGERATD